MTHEIVNMVVSKGLPAVGFATEGIVIRGGVILTCAVLVALAALGTYVWIERPARERLRRVRLPDPVDSVSQVT